MRTSQDKLPQPVELPTDVQYGELFERNATVALKGVRAFQHALNQFPLVHRCSNVPAFAAMENALDDVTKLTESCTDARDLARDAKQHLRFARRTIADDLGASKHHEKLYRDLIEILAKRYHEGDSPNFNEMDSSEIAQFVKEACSNLPSRRIKTIAGEVVLDDVYRDISTALTCLENFSCALEAGNSNEMLLKTAKFAQRALQFAMHQLNPNFSAKA